MNKISDVKCYAICIFIFFLNIVNFVSAQTTFPCTVIAQSPNPLSRSYASPGIAILPISLAKGVYLVTLQVEG